ncbi:MAG: ankyrin repeat domain-containing protein [Chlamydiales bacterium]|nr:ankyrin repeat domain-containing protein [Chlamydiales bacterium]
MSAISSRMLEPQQPLAPPALDDYDKAIFEKRYVEADKILERIYKQNIPEAISTEILRVRGNITLTKIDWDNFRKLQPFQLVENALEKVLRAHHFDACLDLLGQGADPKVQTSTGQSLLHVALEEYYEKPLIDEATRPFHVLHLLLEMGVDPNQKDANGITPLAMAAQKGDIYAVYLLLTYGAIPNKEIFDDLREETVRRDPLYISTGDSLLFAATCTSWLARGILAATGSTEYIDAAVEAIHMAGTVGYLANGEYSWPKVISLAALELIPTTRVYTQLAKTACVALTAISGLTGVYNNYVNRPWDAFKKMTVVTVNSVASLVDVTKVVASEYDHSEMLKRASAKGINSHDIDTQPTWTCDTYKKLLREASRLTHPDKCDGSSQAQIPLVAAYEYMKKTCL